MTIQSFIDEWKTFAESPSINTLNYDIQLALFREYCAIKAETAKVEWHKKTFDEALPKLTQWLADPANSNPLTAVLGKV
jgi:hypothetical protein